MSLHAHNGICFQHTRDILLRIVFDLQLSVVISTSQSTKHRVTLFHYVVLYPAAPSSSKDFTASMGRYQLQRYKKLGTWHMFLRKIFIIRCYFQEKMPLTDYFS